MKTMLVLASIFTAQLALACVQQEAEFIGYVKNFQKVTTDEHSSECTFEIEYTRFHPSLVCPLVPGEVLYERFADKACQLKDNDEVSGVLVKKDDVLFIE